MAYSLQATVSVSDPLTSAEVADVYGLGTSFTSSDVTNAVGENINISDDLLGRSIWKSKVVGYDQGVWVKHESSTYRPYEYVGARYMDNGDINGNSSLASSSFSMQKGTWGHPDITTYLSEVEIRFRYAGSSQGFHPPSWGYYYAERPSGGQNHQYDLQMDTWYDIRTNPTVVHEISELGNPSYGVQIQYGVEVRNKITQEVYTDSLLLLTKVRT